MSELGGNARLLAGGTDLLVKMKLKSKEKAGPRNFYFCVSPDLIRLFLATGMRLR